MDPRKQECLGLYLYGAGYFSRQQNTLGIATGRGAREPHFCLSCRKRAECEDEHEKRVRASRPEEAAKFDELMQAAVRRSVPATIAAAYIGKHGQDPFALLAVENFNRGHADRGRERGALVQ